MWLIVIGLAAAVLVGAMAFYYYTLLGRTASVFDKEIPKKRRLIPVLGSVALGMVSVNIFSAAGIFLLYFLIYSLICDLVRRLARNRTRDSLRPKLGKLWRTSLVPFCAAAVTLVYGFWNIHHFVETDYTLYTKKPLPGEIKILMISDSHYGKVFKSDELHALKPRFDAVDADLVLLVGDVVDENTTKEEMEEIFQVFGSISNKSGVYYVYGNHDRQPYTSEPTFSDQELDDAMAKNGIGVISDGVAETDCGITLVGREDYGSVSRMDLEGLMYDVDRSKYVLMMDHQPLDYKENSRLGTDLIISGHTHAGQIFPAGYFIQLLHTADLWYGYERVGDMDAIVSSGLVGWGYPIRTQKHSEYVVITLKPQ